MSNTIYEVFFWNGTSKYTGSLVKARKMAYEFLKSRKSTWVVSIWTQSGKSVGVVEIDEFNGKGVWKTVVKKNGVKRQKCVTLYANGQIGK